MGHIIPMLTCVEQNFVSSAVIGVVQRACFDTKTGSVERRRNTVFFGRTSAL